MPVYSKTPPAIESKIPRAQRPLIDVGEYVVEIPIPIAMPIGVVNEYPAAVNSDALKLENVLTAEVPTATPSKNW